MNLELESNFLLESESTDFILLKLESKSAKFKTDSNALALRNVIISPHTTST